MSTPPFHLAIALDGTGWHPASWREPGARPAEQYGADFWVEQVREAEAGFASFVTIEDGFRPGPRAPTVPRATSTPR